MNDLETNEDTIARRKSTSSSANWKQQEARHQKEPSALTGVVVLLLLFAARCRRLLLRLPAPVRSASSRLPRNPRTQTVAPARRSTSRPSRARTANREPRAARQHPGRHRSACARARLRLHQKALRRYRRSREGRPGSRRNRSARTRSADPTGAGRHHPSKASIDQANAAVQQAQASLQQGRSNENLAHITDDRFKKLADRKASFRSRISTLTSLNGPRSRLTCRLSKKPWRTRRGKATAPRRRPTSRASTSSRATSPCARPSPASLRVRNIDDGALVNEGNTLLYPRRPDRPPAHLFEPVRSRTPIPCAWVRKPRSPIPDLAGRKFTGPVTRTANSLDPPRARCSPKSRSRTPAASLLPGMYAQVDLAVPRKDPPLVIPGDTLVVRDNGPQVARGRRTMAPSTSSRSISAAISATSSKSSGVTKSTVGAEPQRHVREGVKVKPPRDAKVRSRRHQTWSRLRAAPARNKPPGLRCLPEPSCSPAAVAAGHAASAAVGNRARQPR